MSRRKEAGKNSKPPVFLMMAGGVLLILAGAVLGLRGPYGTADRETANLPPIPTLDTRQVAAGERLYTQYCASCHGAQLEGEPNWKQPRADGSFPAPPHDSSGHTWHHPDALLLDIIANGGDPAQGSLMPGFANQLTNEEMEAILAFIKSYWGDAEREAQWQVTVSQGG